MAFEDTVLSESAEMCDVGEPDSPTQTGESCISAQDALLLGCLFLLHWNVMAESAYITRMTTPRRICCYLGRHPGVGSLLRVCFFLSTGLDRRDGMGWDRDGRVAYASRTVYAYVHVRLRQG